MRHACLIAALLGPAQVGRAADRVAAPPALARSMPSRVVRGDLIMYIPVRGTVEADNVIRIRSPIDGRVEMVKASAETWYHPDDALGYMASSQLAALMDSNHTTPEETLEERWKQVFPLNPLRCPQDCFILSISAKPKTWSHPGEVLFRVAQTLRLEGTLLDEVPEGEQASSSFEMWPRSDPGRRVRVSVEKLSPSKVSAILPFGTNFAPGSAWEGRLEVMIRHNVLKVPTSALLHFKGSTYLPLKVEEGVSLNHETELKLGAREGDEFLILKPDAWDLEVAPHPLPPPSQKAMPRKPSAEPTPLSPGQDSGLYALPDKPAKEPAEDDQDDAQ